MAPPVPRPSPEEVRKRIVTEMRDRVKLDDQQVARLNEIYDRTRQEFDALHKKASQESRAIWDRQKEEVQAMLRPDQVPLYEQVQKKGLSLDELYRRHSEFFGLHDVAEQLLDFDERMQAFRFHHLKLAQRIIGGDVAGTMGTPVEVLRQRMEHGALYKPLWEVRNTITAKHPAPEVGHGT